MTCGIYMIQNKVNNKIYIGQAVDIETRWGEHKANLKANCNKPNMHLQNAWIYYGEDNFEFTIICECDESQLNTMEEYYIFELMSYDREVGYNKTYGGDSGRLTKETKEKISEIVKVAMSRPEVRNKLLGENNPFYGKHHTEATKKKMSKNNYMKGKFGAKCPNAIPVVQLNLEGKLVGVYGASTEAKRHGFTPTSITACIKGKIKTHKGYKWMYLSEYDSTRDPASIETLNLFEKPCEVTPTRSIPVVQLTLEGELVAVYDSAHEAGRNGFISSNITKCIKGKRKTHGGYKWMRLSDYEAMKKEGQEK